MARRKKRAAPAKEAKAVTPEQTKIRNRAADRLKFNQISVDRELERMAEELKEFGERMIKANREAHEEFMENIPKEMGNMTLKEFFEAGYMLDYGQPKDGKFVALGPCHYDIKPEQPEPSKKTVPPQSARESRQAMPDGFATPAPGQIQTPANLFITPKVVPVPKRGYIVLYTENGSPYHMNLATGKAKQAGQPEPEPATITRATRTTRATRAASKR